MIQKQLLPHKLTEIGTATEAADRDLQAPTPRAPSLDLGTCLEVLCSNLHPGAQPWPEFLPSKRGRHQEMVHKMTTLPSYRGREQVDGRLKKHIHMGTSQQMGIQQK